MKDVEQYIRQACAGIPSKKKRADVERELRSHCLDIEDELQNSGIPQEKIQSEILKRLGDLNMLENHLALANKTPWQRWLTFGFSVFVALASFGTVILIAWNYYLSVHHLDAAQQFISEHFEAYAKDQLELSKLDFYRPLPAGKNAASFFLAVERNQALPKAATAFASSIFSAKRFGESAPPEIQSVNLSWMKQLNQFNEWETLSSGQFPKIAWALSVAKVRLVQGLQKQADLPSAISEVYQLAKLTHSAHFLLADLVSVALLGELAEVQDFALTNQMIAENDTKIPSQSEIKRLKRTIRMSVAIIAGVSASEDVRKDLLKHREWRVGICAGLGEASLMQNRAYSKYFPENARWGNVSYASYREWHAVLESHNRTSCHLPSSEVLAKVHKDLNLLTGEEDAGANFVSHIIIVNEILGLNLSDKLSLRAGESDFLFTN